MAESSKLLIMAWPVGGTSPQQGVQRVSPSRSPKSHLFITKDAPKTQEIAKAAGAPDQEPGKRLNVRIKRCSQCSSHGGSHHSPSSSVPGTRGRDQHGYFPLAHGAGAGL